MGPGQPPVGRPLRELGRAAPTVKRPPAAGAFADTVSFELRSHYWYTTDRPSCVGSRFCTASEALWCVHAASELPAALLLLAPVTTARVITSPPGPNLERVKPCRDELELPS